MPCQGELLVFWSRFIHFGVLRLRLSAKMITFAHGYFGLWQKQSNQKGLAPAIGANPDFSCPAQKSFIGQQ